MASPSSRAPKDVEDEEEDVEELGPAVVVDYDSDEDSDAEFRDALDRQVMQLEAEGREDEFSPKFRSLEEARREIEEAGEEYRRRKEEEGEQKKSEGDKDAPFDEFVDAVEEAGQEEKEEEEEKDGERCKDMEVEAREKREEAMSQEEREELMKQAEVVKAEGNRLYLEKQNEEAVTKYSEALDLCPLCFHDQRAVFYANRAAARVNMGSLDMAIDDCHSSLKLKPGYVKALIRRAQIYEQQDKPHEAMKDFEKVLEFDKDNREARVAVKRLPEKIMKKDEQIKQEMFGNLRKLGDMVLNPFGLSVNNFQFEKNEETGSYSVNFKQGGAS